MLPQDSGLTHFSILDAWCGYWLVNLDKKAVSSAPSALLGENLGGISFHLDWPAAGNIFQEKIDTVFGQLHGLTGIADDLFVCRKGENDRDQHMLNMTLQERTKSNSTLTSSSSKSMKCPFLDWHGHQRDSNSMKRKCSARYFSKSPIIRKLSKTPSSAILRHLKSIFAEHGIPEALVTDNGPRYSRLKFEKFRLEWRITHTTQCIQWLNGANCEELTEKSGKSRRRPLHCSAERADNTS